jgi:uroporphyrinogen III methyltransferase/synthase
MSTTSQGIVYLVGAGPGDPGLITLRAIECLSISEVVIHDRLINSMLFKYAPNAEWIDVGKKPHHHPVPQDQINSLLIEKALSGKIVTRLKGGDPFVFGRGGEEALALVKAGVHFEVVPGVSSAIAVPAYAGIPVTHRDIAQSVIFLTGHGSKEEAPISTWECLAGVEGTLVFLMGVHNLPYIVKGLVNGGRSTKTPVALIEQGTSNFQKSYIGTLENIVDRAKNANPPAIIIIGDVVKLNETLQWFENQQTRPLFGLRILDTRPVIQKSLLEEEKLTTHQNNGYIEADDFSSRLSALGATVIPMPSFSLVPSSDLGAIDKIISHITQPATDHISYDWIVFSSAIAVEIFFNHLSLREYDARLLSGISIGVLDKDAAQSLAEFHIHIDYEFSSSNQECLSAELQSIVEKRVLWIHSGAEAQEIQLAMSRSNIRLDELVTCRLVTSPPDESCLRPLLDGKADVITFFDTFAYHQLAKNLQAAKLDGRVATTLNRFNIACSDPWVADVVRSSGVRVDIIAGGNTIPEMTEALVKWRVH